MSAFNEIKLKWDKETHVIPARRVLEAIATIEDVLTIDELHKFLDKGSPPLAKIARAYGALLRFAGADVTDNDVYVGLFSSQGVNVAASVQTLLMLMVPPSSMLSAHMAKASPGNVLAVDTSSSKVSIRPQSRKSGLRRRNSGR